jgi:hypothetical protein
LSGRSVVISGILVVVLFVLWEVSSYGANWFTGGPSDHEIMCGKLSDALEANPPISADARLSVLTITKCF